MWGSRKLGWLRLAGLLCLLSVMRVAPAWATVRYDVSLAQPSRHFFHISMTIPKVADSVVVQMPAWNALYQIRDFGYHVVDFRATDAGGEALRVRRLDKQTWRVQGQGMISVEYDDYWNEAGPFGTQLNGEHAFLNLAMVLCYVPGRRNEDTLVHFSHVPANWHIAVELPGAAGGMQGGTTTSFTAPNYDALVDAPVEIGQFDELRFRAAGRPIRVVIHGDSVDHARLKDMLSKIINYESGLMGGAPFPEYLFVYHIGQGFGGGGMEHANSTAIAVASAAMLPNVSAHEFFHLWNVKRIRPQSLEPVDYTREMWTPSLWFAEGVTNTYAAYTLVRTGLWSSGQFLADLGNQITELETRPAHLWESAEESSLLAWMEKYSLYDQPDFSVSYYNKGQLLGVMLDIIIRDATDNRASLDDVMRRLNDEYARRGRFYPDSAGIRKAAEEVIRGADPEAQADLGDFFARYVAGTDEIPFADFLSRAGFVLQIRGRLGASLGLQVTHNRTGEAVMSDLDPGGVAERAGIREGDLMLALDGGEVPQNMDRWLSSRKPGEVVRVRVRRGDLVRAFSFALGEVPTNVYDVEEAPHPTPKQLRIRTGLLRGITDRAPVGSANVP
jgi:predicted metalloprotease with PDZ domain